MEQLSDFLMMRIHECSFLASLAISAWFYRSFRKLERQQHRDELLNQLLAK